MVAWRRTDFRACVRIGPPLLLATAPRETFERAGTCRKAGTSSREAIRRGHFFSRRGEKCPPPAHPPPPPRRGGSGKRAALGGAGGKSAPISTLYFSFGPARLRPEPPLCA